MFNDFFIILGAGGHGRVVASALLASGKKIFGFTEAKKTEWGKTWFDIPVIGSDEVLANYSPKNIQLVNGLGSVDIPKLRKDIFERQKAKGYAFAPVIHPQAYVSPYAELGEGVQVMAGAIVQAGAKIASNVIINTGAIIDHDCIIGSHCHLAPRTTLSGGVRVGNNCHIGTGAIIIQGIELGDNCMVGAGAVVIRSYPSNSRLIGVPAKVMGLL